MMMKEYLLKLECGSWVYNNSEMHCAPKHIDKIEIPDGANIMYQDDENISEKWFTTKEMGYRDASIVWQRPTPTLEYLNPSDWSLHVINPENDAVPEDWVLVPEGADKFIRATDGIKTFWVNGLQYHEDGSLTGHGEDGMSFKEWSSLWDYDILWQRHTQPEPLPFIDDESVTQTLNQRQQQYGDFEDVAETTEDLFQVLKGGASFVDLSKSQRMALYMICSKMARIVNGDVNYKDNWHDISGYSQLIDKAL